MLIADFDDYATTHPVGMIAISLVVTAVLAGAGMLLFRKKDLK